MRTSRRTFELAVAFTALVAVASMAGAGGRPDWTVVLAFGVVVVLAENTPAFVHLNLSASASLMVATASIAVVDSGAIADVALTSGLVGACGGLYLPQLRAGKLASVGFNAGQFFLSSLSAAITYVVLLDATGTEALAAAVAATACVAVNVGLVIPEIAAFNGERLRVVWADLRPAIPNAVALTLLGLLLGVLFARLGLVAVALLAVPMLVGRWSFASFQRLREAQDASIGLFVRLIEAKDAYTAGHTERVAMFSLLIADELHLSPERSEHLRRSALVHDVGKLAVPNRLLNKPGRLTADEYDVVCRHHSAGVDILAQVDFLRDMALPASDHHGHFDDVAGRMPPPLVLEAHIVAVADAFDAMTSTRSYRASLHHDVAVEELRSKAGTQFNPRCVEALVVSLERRGERYGLGHEIVAHPFPTPPPVVGVGSAGLGDLHESGA